MQGNEMIWGYRGHSWPVLILLLWKHNQKTTVASIVPLRTLADSDCSVEREGGKQKKLLPNWPGLQIERPALCYLSAHHHLGIPVDICHGIFVSLFSLKSHSNKASTTFFQLPAISILVNTRWRPAKESIQWLIRFLMSPQMRVLYIDWVYTLSGYVKSLIAIWTFIKLQCWSSRFAFLNSN